MQFPLLFDQDCLQSRSTISLSHTGTFLMNSLATGFFVAVSWQCWYHLPCRSHLLSQPVVLVSCHLSSYGKETWSYTASCSYLLIIQDMAERKWSRSWLGSASRIVIDQKCRNNYWLWVFLSSGGVLLCVESTWQILLLYRDLVVLLVHGHRYSTASC